MRGLKFRGSWWVERGRAVRQKVRRARDLLGLVLFALAQLGRLREERRGWDLRRRRRKR